MSSPVESRGVRAAPASARRVAVLAVAAACGAALAGVESGTPPALVASAAPLPAALAPRPAPPVDLQRLARQGLVSPVPSGRATPVLRCWQQGRLVVEAPDVVPAPRAAGVLDFHLPGTRDTVLQLLDLQTGLCLVQLRDAR
jgi:hypothetical protein